MAKFERQGIEDPMATLCRMALQTRYADLPAGVTRHAKQTLLDAMGVTIGGSAMEGIPEIVALVKERGGNPQTPLPFYGGRVPAHEAALALGPMPRAMDCGDLHEEAGHVTEYVVPTLLAATGLRGKVSGKEFLAAMAVGQEILVRLGTAYKVINRAIKHHECGGHYIFGAVAAVGKLLGLTQDQLENAQGIARTMTQPNTMGIYSPATLMVRMHHGLVSQAAITCCQLAQRGITGPRDEVLTGPKGYLSTARWETDPDFILHALGEHWEMENIITKGYSACYFSHSSIDAIRELMKAHRFGAADIAGIHIETSTPSWRAVCEPREKKWHPVTVPECQFSLPYVVAIAAFDDKVFLESYNEDARSRPEVRELMTRITAEENPEVSDWGARLAVTLRDGRVLKQECVYVKGHPRNPFTEEDFVAKFRLCVPYAAIELPQQTVDRMIGDILHLDEVDDVAAALLDPLVPSGH
ncbi:2-methylcitrate dehydratase [Burkholderia sp. MSh2]|uniref:MmgE/PrpD family protein n=1 Tax=Burkholderia paludis TaxID=1506587 RepID=A0A6J5EJ08_9BURK|nr:MULTISPECIES: MmgE/PrpD family protein [Burkholderia]KEZ03360.1 2-methylcitrate dehydratase [Burkholderia sp. MSh2]CAB3766529.1 2-methylcitrate dehydratase 2 [Burkholderia paludis]VWC26435.1 MmgE/PrpD family protein [Burkholderia paludis]